ncbi:11_t:CDS:1, partial [Scutellospora calospora]
NMANITEIRSIFFNVNDPFEVPDEEFNDNLWPLVTNIWTQFSSNNLQNGDSWKIYVCRFMKHRTSSTRQEDVPNDKRRKSHI